MCKKDNLRVASDAFWIQEKYSAGMNQRNRDVTVT